MNTLRPESYFRRQNTPKGEREKTPVSAVKVMVDPVKTLGHAPRGRKGRPAKS